jgi:hypothetical protein
MASWQCMFMEERAVHREGRRTSVGSLGVFVRGTLDLTDQGRDLLFD